VFNRVDLEGHREQFGAGLGDSLCTSVPKLVSSNTKTQAFLRGVLLRDVEGFGGVTEGGRV
jgi:hypothetical protein